MPDILQFCRPEEVGVHPDWVCNYVRKLNNQRKMCHSFLMVRHGKVFAEGYWKPFHENWLHRQYSVSKSFVSVAIGLLVDAGKIKLTDKIADHFPDQVFEGIHPLITKMTIRDMLMMATCHKYQTYDGQNDMDWLKTFFQPHYEPDHEPGTEFRYDTSATYTLDVLVERMVGRDFLEFLKDKVLRELGFSGNAWCVKAPEGYAWGGSGVMCSTRDLARFGMLVLNQGNLNGKQYISKEYMEAATGYQINNLEKTVDSIHGHGYGYQFWRQMDGSFGCLGMGGQLVFCNPRQDFIFVCNSDTQGDADGYAGLAQAMWDEVLSKISGETIPADDDAYASMNQLLGNLEVNVPAGEVTSPLAEKVNGITYTLDENPMGIRTFRLELEETQGQLILDTVRGEKVFHFGLGAYEEDVFPESHYSGGRINYPLGRGYRTLHAGLWLESNQFMVRSYIIDDYLGNMKSVFTFDGNQVHLSMTKTAEWFLNEYQGEADGSAI